MYRNLLLAPAANPRIVREQSIASRHRASAGFRVAVGTELEKARRPAPARVKPVHRLVLALVVAALTASSGVALPPSPARTLQSASDVLDGLAATPLNGIPASILADARGVAIIPRVIKAGFVFAGRAGHGVVLTRDRAGAWSGVTFVKLGGASFGFQAGVESADVVLIFRTQGSLNRILRGRGKLTLGADAAVAAGPVGRQAEAGTDARLRAEIVSYSRSRGLFAGVALDGAAILYDRVANDAYSREAGPEMTGLTVGLLKRVARMSTPLPPPLAAPGAILQPPVAVPQQQQQAPVPIRPVPNP